MILGFPISRTEKIYLLFKPPSLWNPVMAAHMANHSLIQTKGYDDSDLCIGGSIKNCSDTRWCSLSHFNVLPLLALNTCSRRLPTCLTDVYASLNLTRGGTGVLVMTHLHQPQRTELQGQHLTGQTSKTLSSSFYNDNVFYLMLLYSQKKTYFSLKHTHTNHFFSTC